MWPGHLPSPQFHVSPLSTSMSQAPTQPPAFLPLPGPLSRRSRPRFLPRLPEPIGRDLLWGPRAPHATLKPKLPSPARGAHVHRNPGRPGAAPGAQGPKMPEDAPPPWPRRPRLELGAGPLPFWPLPKGKCRCVNRRRRASRALGRARSRAAAGAAPRAPRRSPEPGFSGAGRGINVSGRS